MDDSPIREHHVGKDTALHRPQGTGWMANRPFPSLLSMISAGVAIKVVWARISGASSSSMPAENAAPGKCPGPLISWPSVLWPACWEDMVPGYKWVGPMPKDAEAR